MSTSKTVYISSGGTVSVGTDTNLAPCFSTHHYPLVSAYLSVQPQHDDHEEEADGPQLGEGHHGHRSGVGDEGKTGSCPDKQRPIS